jgi:hypothetical protein
MTAADTGQLITIRGLLVMTGSAATAPLRLALRAENVSGTVKVMTGSALIVQKLN